MKTSRVSSFKKFYSILFSINFNKFRTFARNNFKARSVEVSYGFDSCIRTG